MTDFRHETRISARSVTAGCLVTLATMVVLETLAAGFGLWRFNFATGFGVRFGFLFWSAVAWIASSAIGAYSASIASRSVTRADGLVHGFTVWAGCNVITVAALVAFAPGLLGYIAAHAIGVGWISFVGNLLACAVSLGGGVAGAQAETMIETRRGEVTELRRAS